MVAPPPNPAFASNLLSTHRALIDTLASFITVVIHHVLFLRRIYPPVSFLSTRAYNYPVRQNRHPEVCSWINDAVAAIRDQLEKNTVEKVAICIFECEKHQVLERWTLDLRTLPTVAKPDRDVPFDTVDESELNRSINIADLEASFRANLSRLGTTAGKLRPLPEGPNAPECSFTVTIEVKDDADRPVGRLEKEERAWVVTEPDVFDERGHGSNENGSVLTGKTHPIRRLEAGDLRMEMYVEESETKLKIAPAQPSTLERTASLSYGAGSEKFDPMVGYELEKPDINRKPGGGSDSEYQRG